MPACRRLLSENRKHTEKQSGHLVQDAMLTFLNIAQLVLYIALLALLGQGVLYVLAGPKRESNFFYKLLQVLSKPFTVPMRRITPRQVADEHVPLVTFFLLVILYAVVTFERADLCITSNMVGQAGCR
jgi:hypothetical protein